jgi:hypothetical protein
MEILIIGGVLVVIMVIISTQIKKAAARAFEKEVIETEDFTIIKPAGLMNPIRNDSPYAFEAYSKEYGDKNERNIWRAQAYLTVDRNLNFTEASKKAKSETDKILSEEMVKDAPASQKIQLLEGEKIEDNVAFCLFYKIVESKKQRKTYSLRVKVLKAFQDEYLSRVEEMSRSFQLK